MRSCDSAILTEAVEGRKRKSRISADCSPINERHFKLTWRKKLTNWEGSAENSYRRVEFRLTHRRQRRVQASSPLRGQHCQWIRAVRRKVMRTREPTPDSLRLKDGFVMHLPSVSGRLLCVRAAIIPASCRCWPLNPHTATDGDGKERQGRAFENF
jgi:hypothetical protein